MRESINRRSWLRAATSIFFTALLLTVGIGNVNAAPGNGNAKGKIKGPGPFHNTINLSPTVNSLQVVDGQLTASGTVTATLKGQTVTAPFTAPVDIALADDQSAATDCPILHLTLGPINLNLLGLVVETSPICLDITAHDGQGLLGDLLCNVGNLLNSGLDIGQILNGLGLTDPVTGAVVLPGVNVNDLLAGVTGLLNGVLSNLLGSVVSGIEAAAGSSCDILHLELGPLDLTLLGLEVVLDNCNNGPVVVDVSAVTGQGNLLGNLLCELLGGGQINLGATLQGILNQILGLLGGV